MTSDDRLIFAFEKGLAYFEPGNTSSMERIADFELDIEGTRMNDGRVDPFGRFLVGGYHSDPEKLVSSMYVVFYRFRPFILSRDYCTLMTPCITHSHIPRKHTRNQQRSNTQVHARLEGWKVVCENCVPKHWMYEQHMLLS